MKKTRLLCLVECAMMLAFATVLSFIKLLDLPYGGSITVCSALPILVVAYRHGLGWGLSTGLAHGLIQLLLGSSTLSYATSWQAAVAIVLLDYVLAFAALGLGGLFRNGTNNQGTALVLGALLTGVMRYLFHVISGCTVWAGISIPTAAALVYSLGYNATYMIPETLVNMVAVWYLSRALDLRQDTPTRAPATAPLSAGALVCNLVAFAATAVAVVWDVVLVFTPLQDAESGAFVITGLADVRWSLFGIVTLVGGIIAVAFRLASRQLSKKE